MNANVRLTIDRIVLHGFAHVPRARVHAAVETELARLFAEHGVPTHFRRSQQHSRLDAGAFRAAPDVTPEHLGAQLAQTLYRGGQP